MVRQQTVIRTLYGLPSTFNGVEHSTLVYSSAEGAKLRRVG